jgi:hypothetical protein
MLCMGRSLSCKRLKSGARMSCLYSWLSSTQYSRSLILLQLCWSSYSCAIVSSQRVSILDVKAYLSTYFWRSSICAIKSCLSLCSCCWRGWCSRGYRWRAYYGCGCCWVGCCWYGTVGTVTVGTVTVGTFTGGAPTLVQLLLVQLFLVKRSQLFRYSQPHVGA